MDDFIDSSPSASEDSGTIREKKESDDQKLIMFNNEPLPQVYEDRMGVIKRHDAELNPNYIKELALGNRLATQGQPQIQNSLIEEEKKVI